MRIRKQILHPWKTGDFSFTSFPYRLSHIVAINTISSFPHYRKILKNLGDNIEGDSDHSDKVTSNEDEAEGTAVTRDANSKVGNVQDDLSSRLRTRPVVKRFIDKKYGTIVGVDSLKKPPPRKSSCADSAAAQTKSEPKWTAKLVSYSIFLCSHTMTPLC